MDRRRAQAAQLVALRKALRETAADALRQAQAAEQACAAEQARAKDAVLKAQARWSALSQAVFDVERLQRETQGLTDRYRDEAMADASRADAGADVDRTAKTFRQSDGELRAAQALWSQLDRRLRRRDAEKTAAAHEDVVLARWRRAP